MVNYAFIAKAQVPFAARMIEQAMYTSPALDMPAQAKEEIIRIWTINRMLAHYQEGTTRLALHLLILMPALAHAV